MHVFTDSEVALRDAVARPSKWHSSWELLDLAKQDRTLNSEQARQRTKAKKQQEIAYERQYDWGDGTFTEGTILKKLGNVELLVFPIHWLVAQSGLEFPVDECSTREQPAM
jgi:hypothetical protein